MPTIDLNADIGEGLSSDAALIPLLSSVNIACGGHAGTPETMRESLRRAKGAGVAPGAHPSFPDREGFGRHALDMPLSDLSASLHEQVRDLTEIATSEGLSLRHLKPHGALYHASAEDAALAALLIEVANRFGGLFIVGPANSLLETMTAKASLRFYREGFADRGYTARGTLIPRGEPGDILPTSALVAAQGLKIAKDGVVTTPGGDDTPCDVETLCLHGDHPKALDNAKTCRAAFLDHGIDIEGLA